MALLSDCVTFYPCYFIRKMRRVVCASEKPFYTGRSGMANLLTDRIKTLNDINKMEQSARTNQMDKCNLTGCLKIISHFSIGQAGGCLTW